MFSHVILSSQSCYDILAVSAVCEGIHCVCAHVLFEDFGDNVRILGVLVFLYLRPSLPAILTFGMNWVFTCVKTCRSAIPYGWAQANKIPRSGQRVVLQSSRFTFFCPRPGCGVLCDGWETMPKSLHSKASISGGGIHAAVVRRCPKAVILVDELETLHPKVASALIPVLKGNPPRAPSLPATWCFFTQGRALEIVLCSGYRSNLVYVLPQEMSCESVDWKCALFESIDLNTTLPHLYGTAAGPFDPKFPHRRVSLQAGRILSFKNDYDFNRGKITPALGRFRYRMGCSYRYMYMYRYMEQLVHVLLQWLAGVAKKYIPPPSWCVVSTMAFRINFDSNWF